MTEVDILFTDTGMEQNFISFTVTPQLFGHSTPCHAMTMLLIAIHSMSSFEVTKEQVASVDELVIYYV